MSKPTPEAGVEDHLLIESRSEFVSNPFEIATSELCRARPEVLCMSADLADHCDVLTVRNTLPDQFVEVGMAEQNLMAVASGLSKAGFIPIATTFACYASRRAFDQMLICMGTGPRTGIVVGFTPGISSPARIHHQSLEDYAMVRAVPNATVIDPMDAVEMDQIIRKVVDREGLIYMRGLRAQVPVLLDREKYEFEVGKTYLLRDGGKVGIISTGLGSQWAVEASDLLLERDFEHSLLHAPTIKPVNEDEILDFCARHDRLYTIENHQISGGLGGMVAEIMTNAGLGRRLTRLGVPNTWAPGGTLPYIRAQLGLDAESIANTIMEGDNQ